MVVTQLAQRANEDGMEVQHPELVNDMGSCNFLFHLYFLPTVCKCRSGWCVKCVTSLG